MQAIRKRRQPLHCMLPGMLLLTLSVLACPAAALAFKIVAPGASAPLESGTSVTVAVDLGKDEGIVKVLYYWYPASGEVLIEQSDREAFIAPTQTDAVTSQPIVATPSLVGLSNSTPPFGGTLSIPKDAIGAMRLLAIADVSRGRLGTRTTFDELVVHIEPSAALTELDFETEKPLRLGRIGQGANYEDIDARGKLMSLPVVGLFADGVTRSLADPSSGTSLTSSNDTVVSIEPFGLVRLVGSGTATITASNRGKSAILEIETDLSEEPNRPPIAEAGESRRVRAGKKVELNGLRSRDPEGEALAYYWSQVRGNHISLLDPNMPRASFLAPLVSEPRTYRFKLRVTDKQGADSLPAFVDVTVEP